MTQDQEPQVKHCPFNHTDCLQGRCALFIEMTVIQQTPIAGLAKKQVSGVCAFLALLQMTSISANKQPVMMPGRPPQMPFRSNS